jgi:hypothetical protein
VRKRRAAQSSGSRRIGIQGPLVKFWEDRANSYRITGYRYGAPLLAWQHPYYNERKIK